MKSSTGSFRIHGPSSVPMKAYLTPSVITWAIVLPQPSFRFWSAMQLQLSIVQHLQSVVIFRNVYGMIVSTVCFCEQGIFFVLLINRHLSNWEAQRMSEIICSHKMLIEYLWVTLEKKKNQPCIGSQGKSCVCQIIYLKSAIRLALSKSWAQSKPEYIYRVDVFFPKEIRDTRDLNLEWFQEPMARNESQLVAH